MILRLIGLKNFPDRLLVSRVMDLLRLYRRRDNSNFSATEAAFRQVRYPHGRDEIEHTIKIVRVRAEVFFVLRLRRTVRCRNEETLRRLLIRALEPVKSTPRATFQEEAMRRLALTVAGAAALLSGDSLTNHATAMMFASPASMQAVIDFLGIAEDVQYFYGGRNYCWYPYGWNGPGWYWCGYASRRGLVGAEARVSAVGASEEVTMGGTWPRRRATHGTGRAWSRGPGAWAAEVVDQAAVVDRLWTVEDVDQGAAVVRLWAAEDADQGVVVDRLWVAEDADQGVVVDRRWAAGVVAAGDPVRRALVGAEPDPEAAAVLVVAEPAVVEALGWRRRWRGRWWRRWSWRRRWWRPWRLSFVKPAARQSGFRTRTCDHGGEYER